MLQTMSSIKENMSTQLMVQTTMELVSSSLKLLIEMLPNTQFTQVHKSFVVNNAKVIAVETDTLTKKWHT